jgi:hypothetical protein
MSLQGGRTQCPTTSSDQSKSSCSCLTRVKRTQFTLSLTPENEGKESHGSALFPVYKIGIIRAIMDACICPFLLYLESKPRHLHAEAAIAVHAIVQTSNGTSVNCLVVLTSQKDPSTPYRAFFWRKRPPNLASLKKNLRPSYLMVGFPYSPINCNLTLACEKLSLYNNAVVILNSS